MDCVLSILGNGWGFALPVGATYACAAAAKGGKDDMKDRMSNKRGAGKGGLAVLWRAGRAWPALPDHER